MQTLLIFTGIALSVVVPSPPDSAPLTEHGRNVLNLVTNEKRADKVDVYLRLESQPVVDDIAYSILPDPNVPDLNEATQRKRFLEIKELIEQQKLEGIGPIETDEKNGNSFIKPSIFIKPRKPFQVRLEVASGALPEVIGPLCRIHPAVFEVDIELLEKMVLVSPEDPLSFDAVKTGISLCAIDTQSDAIQFPDDSQMKVLGSAGTLSVFAATSKGVSALQEKAREKGLQLRPASSKDLSAIRSASTVSLDAVHSPSMLRELCPRARMLQAGDGFFRLALNAAERKVLAAKGFQLK